MTFPGCKHRPKTPATGGVLRWLAAEPFRLFFISGALWSLLGVLLWPLYLWQHLGFYPNICHARLMIEAFGGAFVVGFLGTAGPRMASAPKLTAWELLWLMGLHQGSSICHLLLRHSLGDLLFALLLLSLMGALVTRTMRFRQDAPPPQMLLAVTGLLCGTAGALLLVMPETYASLARLRLANLLLYQGLLLPPVLGIGSFIFPRILGGGFGEPKTPRQTKASLLRAAGAAGFIVFSFWLEAQGQAPAGGLLRTLICTMYLCVEVRWRGSEGTAPRGSLARGLPVALITAAVGLAAAGWLQAQRVALEHLLFVSGFGLLIFIVASRVLFGHSGELPAFQQRAWTPRLLVTLGLLAAATRMIPGFLPQLAFTHYQYAALTWVVMTVIWLVWHRRRFSKREPE
jgi:uncharacterized protein involved in response to NO